MSTRYALAPALALIAIAAASYRLIRFPPLLLGLLALIGLYIAPNLRQISASLEQTKRTHELESELASLSNRAEVRAAVELCPALVVRATQMNIGWAQLGATLVGLQLGRDWNQVPIRKGFAPSPEHSEFVFHGTGWTFRSPCLHDGDIVAQRASGTGAVWPD
jgi:hypothetical protein